MNYNKIKVELEKRKITVRDFCQQIEITEQGLHQMIRNGSMKVEVLEKISDILCVPVAYWFEENTTLYKEKGCESYLQEDSDNTYGSVNARQIDSVTSELNRILKAAIPQNVEC